MPPYRISIHSFTHLFFSASLFLAPKISGYTRRMHFRPGCLGSTFGLAWFSPIGLSPAHLTCMEYSAPLPAGGTASQCESVPYMLMRYM
ncbi:hypothetical protein M433DRAFT_254770 [Acidomyces richmondensis BFW]|nr:hypothetical protein M433DRAFT_254770 [Acidomyces richmondensis BFW]